MSPWSLPVCRNIISLCISLVFCSLAEFIYNSRNFLWIPWNFLDRLSCHLEIGSIYFLFNLCAFLFPTFLPWLLPSSTVFNRSDLERMLSHFSRVWLLSYQAPPPMGFSRQEYWSGVPLPSLTCLRDGYKSSLRSGSPHFCICSSQAEKLHLGCSFC